jgi:AraC-like DNA-binding protein
MKLKAQSLMSLYQRIPAAPLNEYVGWLWCFSDYYPDHERQFVLPDGTFELIINLEDRPRKLFDRHNFTRHRSFRRGWISGTQREYLVIDALPGSSMIGAHFKPGGAGPFVGLPADELCDQVVELDALWGNGAWEWRDRLLAAMNPLEKLTLLEQLLLQRLLQWQRDAERNKKVNWALTRFLRESQVQSIHAVATELGMSHKHFISQFKSEVGLTPKLFCRIRRFHQVLARIHSRRSVVWADVACSCGYFDQAHFVNDFVAFAGVNPSAYLRQQLEDDPKFIRASA